MTPKFDKLITEILTPSNKKREGRYWSVDKPGLSAAVRAPRNLGNKNASQRTKLGNQQYVGGSLDPRKRNISRKPADETSIAKGIGGHIRIDGTNPKQIGASVNSKQGNMEIKVVHPNGTYKVGPRHRSDILQDYLDKQQDM